uniref:Acyltransferase 3 domain-containing protein n=1 Tax=Anopheles epiroticus TaxID=199890 RepID=A0A182PVM8_9DIPT
VVICRGDVVSTGEQRGHPALYELDDWRECDIAPERDWYCVVRVILTGDAVERSRSPFEVDDGKRFRRTLLDRGVCLKASQRTVRDGIQAGSKLPASWNRADRYILNRTYFPHAMHPDVWTELAASELISDRLAVRHPALRAYTEIEYCLKSDPKPEYDRALGVTLAVTLGLACVLLLKARSWILPEFSPPKTQPIKQLVVFDLHKCFGAVGVVIAHCCLFGSFLMPMENIELLEEVIGHPNAKLWRLLCPFLMLVFFMMSSMLLTVKLLQGDATKRPTLGAIIAHRLIRLMPVNLLMVGFGTLAYDRFAGAGPLTARQLIVENGFCRSHWWMNLLFISNFNMQAPCLPDSWYVSADMQLYVLIALILQIIFRYPKKIVTILALAIACSFLGPFLTVLWTDFDPIGPSNFHEMRFFLIGSSFMSQLYTPFYNNLAWSVGGMMAGMVYDRFQRFSPNSQERKRMLNRIHLAVKMSLAVLLVSIYCSIEASNEELQDGSRLWLALCYSTYRLSGACFITASFLRIVLSTKVTQYNIPPIVRVGATLYYCVYFIHFPIMHDYELMPPLFHYENLTQCFEQYPTSAYCVVKTVVKPTESSEVWRAIEKYSKYPSYHEHSLLDRGLCVDACATLLDGLSSSVKATLNAEPITVEPYHLLTLPSADELPDQRARYGTILNMCVNHQLQQRYNLSGYSELEHCVTAETHRPTVDGYHVLFLAIVAALCGLVAVASYTDWRYTPAFDNNNESSTAKAQRGRHDALWMEFALQRTWSQLVAAPQRSNRQRDFAFVEILRMLSVFIILVIHVTMCYIAGPTANMRSLEEFYGLTPSLVAASVFPFLVRTFFAISGVMLAVHFLEYGATRPNRVGWSFLWKGIVMRYVRIFPVLFVVWLYQVSWFDWFARGPGDYRYFALEKDYCRTNGWLNFLFLNNYFKSNEMCMQQTWHLTADFQFFLAGLPLLILINRHPRLLWPLISLTTVFSIAAPIATLYYHKLPGVILVNFKQLRFIFYVHPALLNDYMLFHPHTSSYFSGLFAGLAYHRYRTASVPLLAGGTTATLLKWVPPAMVLLQALLAPLLYGLDYSEPILWNAIYGAVHRCCWGAMCAVGILYGATLWQGRHSRLHFHPLLQLLSKLSFGVYMVQFNVLKSLTQNGTGNGIEFSSRIFFEAVMYTWVVCYAVALVLALTVELPAAAIFKRIF